MPLHVDHMTGMLADKSKVLLETAAAASTHSRRVTVDCTKVFDKPNSMGRRQGKSFVHSSFTTNASSFACTESENDQ